MQPEEIKIAWDAKSETRLYLHPTDNIRYLVEIGYSPIPAGEHATIPIHGFMRINGGEPQVIRAHSKDKAIEIAERRIARHIETGNIWSEDMQKIISECDALWVIALKNPTEESIQPIKDMIKKMEEIGE